MKLNGWIKKNISVILQLLIIAAIVIATSATIKAEVSHLQNDVATIESKNNSQDDDIQDIKYSLGRIEGKLDTLLRKED